MLEPDPLRTAARQQRRLNRLTAGGHQPVCFRCGHSDVAALERHHYMNRVHHDALTVNVCRNCHRTLTEQLEAAGVMTEYTNDVTPLDTLAGFLGGLSVMLADVASTLHEWCAWLAVLQSANAGGLAYPKFTPGRPNKGQVS